MKQLVESATSILNDLQEVLLQLPPSSYSEPIPALSGGTIGQHTRHIIEFFQCLLDQTDSGAINYCTRKRDKFIESKPTLAISSIRSLSGRLNQLNAQPELQLLSGEFNTEPIATNLARELLYNIEHAIHHMAVIKIGLQLASDPVRLPDTFGVAPSTLRFRQKSIALKTILKACPFIL